MGVGVSCPKCYSSFAFYCNKCLSYNIEINKGFEPEKYFLIRAAFYLKCRKCQSEYDHVICPDCSTKIFPSPPFVKGDAGGGKAKGCFIATACLDGNSQILKQLYLFRDEFLENNQTGKKFIKYYYMYSPALASRIHNDNLLKSFSKFLIVYPAYYASLIVMKIIAFHKK
jgi:hypothetical protein